MFGLDYYFEEQKYLLFQIFDANIKDGKEVKSAIIMLRIEEVSISNKEVVALKFSAEGLKNPLAHAFLG